MKNKDQIIEAQEWWAELPLDGSVGQIFTDSRQLTKGGRLIRVRQVAYDPLSPQRPIPATENDHDKTCICMYCKPELWPDDSEENKYRDLAAERWNLYHELLMAVENKYEGESRHETALRLIREAQKSDTSTNQEEA